MRGRVAADPQASGVQPTRDHRGDRSLAVGAGDDDGEKGALGPVEGLHERADRVEPELDAEELARGESLLRRHACVCMNLSASASGGLQLAAIDDHVDHAVLDEELRALEALGQLLADRLLDDPRARRSR